MQFITLAALFGAAAMAAPAPQTSDCPNPAHCTGPPNPDTYENINIKDFFLRKAGDNVTAVSFELSGNNATDLECNSTGGITTLPSEIFTCGDSKYRFGINRDDNGDFPLTIYHELGPAVGFWGQGVVPTYCHAGGGSVTDIVCAQVDSTYTQIITGSG